ncbi:MAG: hypothetical protein M3N18_10840 [Actinomycetota bacterium]|nr:hypothetical protein [Actinomycetota bacterium]
MRQTVLGLVVGVLLLALASGVALAATKYSTDGPDKLFGTKGDVIYGYGSDDLIFGRAGSDDLRRGSGSDSIDTSPCGYDVVHGGSGNDSIDVTFSCIYTAEYPPPPLQTNVVNCGPGFDKVQEAQREDEISTNCEGVTRP